MRVKLTITTVWDVSDEDRAIAEQMLKDQPADIIDDYIADAWHGDKDMETPKATAELVEG